MVSGDVVKSAKCVATEPRRRRNTGWWMATGPKRPSKKKDGGRQTRSVLATTLSSSCLAVSAVAVPTPVPQNLVSFTDYPVSNVLEKLLIDKTTGRRLTMGGAQGAVTEITPALLSRKPSPVLPRVEKSRETQGARTKKNAEVFTPSWLCAKMNDFLDVEMLSDREATGVSLLRDDAHRGSGALAASFDWRRYVDTRILEITCGEAPFIVSRYDAATGKLIPVKERIGLLDRKLRAVNENAADEDEWMKWAVRAYESVYGYEYQGDSLAIARANLLITFAENLEARWGRKATIHELTIIANRIAWNFWQMDGLTGMVSVWKTIEIQHLPGFDPPKQPEQMEFFSEPKEEKKGTPLRQNKACVIFDWRARRPITYNEIGKVACPHAATNKKGTKTMKFDYAIGNPPYQEETGGTCTSDKPIYNVFMDESYKVADKVELITPARFLFNAGATPKAWNKKMLADPHLKVLEYTQKSDVVFANTDIKGGVAVTYHDVTREFGTIDTFTSFPELNAILKKVESKAEGSLADIISNRGLYRFSKKAYAEHPEELKKTSDPRISTDAFEEMPSLFTEEKPKDGHEYFKLLGNLKGRRVYRWFRIDYYVPVNNLTKFKVVLPNANGSGAIGEVLSTPIISTPMIGFTETYISVGEFGNKTEAEACLKYVKTKFARTMLGVLKITQHNSAPVWRKVPLQDFTSKSDINWSGTIEEIDRQLYKKYKLTKAEIKFIETHVKAME